MYRLSAWKRSCRMIHAIRSYKNLNDASIQYSGVRISHQPRIFMVEFCSFLVIFRYQNLVKKWVRFAWTFWVDELYVPTVDPKRGWRFKKIIILIVYKIGLLNKISEVSSSETVLTSYSSIGELALKIVAVP